MHDTLQVLLWGGFPYAVIAIFIVGHVWRYSRDQYTWTTRSTQLLERRKLMIGTLLFHFGMLAVVGGHLGGLLVPEEWTDSVGVTDEMYHRVALVMGTLAGVAMMVGMLILLLRRTTDDRVKATTIGRDYVAATMLLLAMVTGLVATIGFNAIGEGHNYRETISPWIRGIITLRPTPGLMKDVPLAFQLHVISALSLFALWPFTRLVHAWSVPVGYLRRPFIVYRAR